jgi:hypothetical protein
LNAGEYGLIFAFYTAFDMSGYSLVSLEFTRPDLTTFTVSNPNVTVPPDPFVTAGPTFPANQYGQYTFKNGDISIAGVYQCRMIYATGTAPTYTQYLISDVATFTVDP